MPREMDTQVATLKPSKDLNSEDQLARRVCGGGAL